MSAPNPKALVASFPTATALALPEFYQLAQVPPEVEWFANIENAGTRRMYKDAIADFMRFYAMTRPDQFREVTRAHIIKWRDELKARHLSPATIRRKLSTL